MRLFTLMPLQAYKDTLEKAGKYVCDYSKTGNDECNVEDNYFYDFEEWHCILNGCPCVADAEDFDSEWDIARTGNQRELECFRVRLLKTSAPGPQRVRGIFLAKTTHI
ncbi:hypothetical protein IJV57_05095 [Candidatus Saccharibacteria bacterium]|nr:hypothetical protein [Candidatus Saccharibacteria bacterium]